MEKDLQNKEAIEKLKSMAEDIRFCMYTTYANEKIESRPMTTQQIDENGNVWFFTNRNTDIGDGSNQGEPVTLIYSEPKNNTYISVSGKAEIVEDEAKKEELWNPMAKAWFPEGKEDPNLVLLKVTTGEAAYWDATSSKMVVFFSMVKAVLTGTTPDGGDHGKLNLA
ncbi:pyridoxamine 5'-phosphate oxidase family protein [Dyadobacter chenhuakuii]|jgi:general stress protein 26|uniref:Pyridoxamine 5'-phosphate oxidase family protein n=1 Tax=Dyadobacter chenhuakuii TaxID=2909339 RepID=A0A9X1QCQ1_9BACT|nr:pyridoxamine 5'-phosphate oxidase family protein [Dyadobacter chenhuakuii]MCF2492044.1 pyridoxamine 5'-phosphate oxidase family protein [Dyadobacter chenhuakuii]MCF2498599.1 pyridoxamine 5'-phosphate oxidase family protein [Dyadobacter chenhuakuii]USJ28795.1 pyridoxamine 5'-phosphate oxidase family protein [Dyadobacter chenhuakuii]